MQRMNKLNTCFKDRSRHSVWNHVIIYLFYSIHVSVRNHGRDVRAEYIQQMLKEKEGSFLFLFFLIKKKNEQNFNY